MTKLTEADFVKAMRDAKPTTHELWWKHEGPDGPIFLAAKGSYMDPRIPSNTVRSPTWLTRREAQKVAQLLKLEFFSI